ncbi:hypothetical protein ACG3SL_03820 [Sphingomonas sp. CJ20]
MRMVVVAGLIVLGGCGGGGTTGANYADAPPMAEIVATPTPRQTEAPQAEIENDVPAYAITNDDAEMIDNAAE